MPSDVPSLGQDAAPSHVPARGEDRAFKGHSMLGAAEETDPDGRLRAYADLLRRLAIPYGMVSRRDADRLYERHVLDSTRALRCIPRAARTAVDIGSGAGLPGIPVAICRPDLHVFLLEPRRSRISVLETAVSELGLTNVEVIAGRAEGVPVQADVALARALGGPDASWRLAAPLVSAAGCLIYFAGRSWSGAEWISRLGAAGVTGAECEPARDPMEGPLVMMRRTAPIGQ